MYQHPTSESNSGTSYKGKNVFMTYYDQGQLEGIPQLCMNPVTQLKQDCVTENGASDKTTNIDDLVLSNSTLLTDLSGNSYYALHQVETQYFPKASVTTVCAGLTFATIPSTPTIKDIYVAPKNEKAVFPTDADLASKYLSGGKPVVSKGVTAFEA
jgi:hypothetical protein